MGAAGGLLEDDEESIRLWRAIVASPSGRIGLALILANIVIFAFGPYLAPYDPAGIGVGRPAEGPSVAHWLGTDALGRDVLSRLLAGGRDVIVAPLVAVLLSFATGGLLGMLSGYRGGRADALLTKFLDVVLAIPPLLIALVVIAAWGSNSVTVVLVVALVFAPRVSVILRSAVRAVRHQEYVLAAEARGEPSLAIVLREILPNITGPALVEFGIRLTYAVLFIASLAVLGFGAQPPSSNWGLMVSESRVDILDAPLTAVAPATAIAALLIGINLVADALSTHLSRQAVAA